MVTKALKNLSFFIIPFLLVSFIFAMPYVQLQNPMGVHNNSGISEHVVGNWWFEQNASDISGNGNDGTVNGDVENVTGIVGYAYEFDGDGDYITLPYINLSYGDKITVSAWIKTKDSANSMYILRGGWSDSYYWKLYYSSADKISWVVRSTTAVKSIGGNTILNLNEWHHFVGTYDGSYIRVYVDGKEDATAVALTGNIRDYNRNTLIGGDTDPYGKAYNGTIDEVLIFNRSLSSGEISGIYNETKKGFKIILPNQNQKPYIQLGKVKNFE